MASAADALSSLQPSDYGTTDISLQDYGALDNSGLAAPSYDTPLGVDPFSGTSIYDGNPSDPSLTTLGNPAGDGSNAYNDGLLPLTNPNPLDSNTIAASQYSGTNMSTQENLPLTSLSNAAKTQLGSPTATPVANPSPMGSSLWASLFGTTTTAALGAAKAGTAGNGKVGSGAVLGGVKPAPKTAISNPISGMSTALIIGVVASLIGIILWSFSGGK